MSAATAATAPVLPGGFGDAAAISRCAAQTTAPPSMAASRERASCGKTAPAKLDAL